MSLNFNLRFFYSKLSQKFSDFSLNTKLKGLFCFRFFLYLFPPEPEFTPEEVGHPLYLTPYIKENRIPEARDRALVRGLQWPGLISYAGFLTVNPGSKQKMKTRE